MKPTAFAYSIKEACALTSLGRTSVYAAIARGDLKTKKVGRRTLIGAQDLKSWLESTATTETASDRVCGLPSPALAVPSGAVSVVADRQPEVLGNEGEDHE